MSQEDEASPSPTLSPGQPRRCDMMAARGGGEGKGGVWIRGISKEDSAGFNKHFSVDQNPWLTESATEEIRK